MQFWLVIGMLLWPWELFRLPFRRRNGGQCPSCRAPFGRGQKRRLVDTCGHPRCYACLCLNDEACPLCPKRLTKIIHESFRIKLKKRDSTAAEDFLEGIDCNVVPEDGEAKFLKLKPLYFEVPRLEGDNFLLPRGWLFREIDQIVSSAESRGLAIIGKEGSGKTSILLQLVEESCFGPKWKKTALNYQSDSCKTEESLIEYLGSLVVGYHFCQSDCHETCLVPDFIHSFAAQLCQAPQLEKYKHFLLQQKSYEQLIGIDACREDPNRAFAKGILEPLNTLVNIPRCLLLIDGIDEAEDSAFLCKNALASFIASHLRNFPHWLKVIVSGQTRDAIASMLLRSVHLDTVEYHVQEDILRYIRYRIHSDAAIRINISAHANPSRFASHLAVISDGSFLFVKTVLDLLQRNYLVIKSSTFNVLPVSLNEAFSLNFNFRFPSVNSFSKVAPILEVCLASSSPPTASEIFYSIQALSIHPTLSWDEFSQQLEMLSEVLVKRNDGSLMFLHPAFRQWLLSNNKFRCNIRVGHSAIALLMMRCGDSWPLTKQFEFVQHSFRSNLFENFVLKETAVQAMWMQLAPIDVNLIKLEEKQKIRFMPGSNFSNIKYRRPTSLYSVKNGQKEAPALNFKRSQFHHVLKKFKFRSMGPYPYHFGLEFHNPRNQM